MYEPIGAFFTVICTADGVSIFRVEGPADSAIETAVEPAAAVAPKKSVVKSEANKAKAPNRRAAFSERAPFACDHAWSAEGAVSGSITVSATAPSSDHSASRQRAFELGRAS